MTTQQWTSANINLENTPVHLPYNQKQGHIPRTHKRCFFLPQQTSFGIGRVGRDQISLQGSKANLSDGNPST